MSNSEPLDYFLGAVQDDDRAQDCVARAGILWTQYQNTWDEHLLNQVIDLQREALKLRPPGHPYRDHSCFYLAAALRTHYRRTGDKDVLAEVIALDREGLTLCPPGHPDRHWSCADLVSSLENLYNCTGDDNLLSEAIDLSRELLMLRPPGHPQRDNACGNLASSLQMQYNRTGDEHLLTEAIDMRREALRLRPPGHSGRHFYCANLAASLQTQYNRTKDEHLLIEAIAFDREGLALRPPGHPERHHSLSNLALALRKQYNLTRDERLLTESIDLNREALLLRPPGHPYRHMSCAHLALSLQTQYNRTQDEHLLIEAIAFDREGLSLRPPGHPNRDYSCANLASSLQLFYNRAGDDKMLTEAIDLYCEGATLSSAHTKWSRTLELSRIYLMQKTPHHSVPLATHYLEQSLLNDPDDPSDAISQVLVILDLFWTQGLESKHHTCQTLLSVYQRITTLLPLLSNPVFDLASQLQRLRDAHQLGADAFLNAVLAGDWRAGLEQLEVAQGIIWAQRLHQRDPQLCDVPEAQATELQSCLQAFQACRSPAFSTINENQVLQTSRDDLHRYSSHMYATIRQIRTLPGLERFMLGETYEAICKVTSNNPAVVLVGARGHFFALIIASGRVCGDGPLKLDLTGADIEISFVYGKQSPHRGASASEIIDADNRGMHVTQKVMPLDRYLQLLWLKIVKPVFGVLQLQPLPASKRPRLHWCPTGPFASVPLHAAGIYNGSRSQRVCCADYVVSSYTPSLTTLLRAQRTVAPLLRKDLAMMLLAEKRAQEPLALIPGVELETLEVARIATLHHVNIVGYLANSTTVASTSECIKAANIMHIACHGIQDHEDATRSGFGLGDGRLSISDLMQLEIKTGFLAFLSACETAKGSKDQPDQAMHLAAAMLFVGFKSVIATMWAISDEDGPKVAKWFYEDLFAKERVDVDVVAYALDNAVAKLRKSGVPSHRWVPFIHMGA